MILPHARTRTHALLQLKVHQPKQPLSGYLHFCKKKREKLHRKHPELAPNAVTVKLGKRWKSMDTEARVSSLLSLTLLILLCIMYTNTAMLYTHTHTHHNTLLEQVYEVECGECESVQGRTGKIQHCTSRGTGAAGQSKVALLYIFLLYHY